MKTSSKILIGLLSTILIVMIAVFVDIKVFGEHRSMRVDTSKMKDIFIDDFKYVRVDDFKSLKLSDSDRNYFRYV